MSLKLCHAAPVLLKDQLERAEKTKEEVREYLRESALGRFLGTTLRKKEKGEVLGMANSNGRRRLRVTDQRYNQG